VPSERLEQAELQRALIARTRDLVANLQALLAGRMTRAVFSTWLDELSPPKGVRHPFPKQPAFSVWQSLCLAERHEGEFLVRDVELRAYLRWLTAGESWRIDEDPLFGLNEDIEAFAARTGTEAIRWWLDGLGWWVSTRFCSLASGRPYMVDAELRRSTMIAFYAQLGIDPTDAVLDLFEALAIDDSDVTFLDPRVDLARLPVWALMRQDDNGNVFEIARLRAYSKACAQARVFTDRGHKQLYWVEPA
jgi:hypothetical protein